MAVPSSSTLPVKRRKQAEMAQWKFQGDGGSCWWSWSRDDDLHAEYVAVAATPLVARLTEGWEVWCWRSLTERDPPARRMDPREAWLSLFRSQIRTSIERWALIRKRMHDG